MHSCIAAPADLLMRSVLISGASGTSASLPCSGSRLGKDLCYHLVNITPVVI